MEFGDLPDPKEKDLLIEEAVKKLKLFKSSLKKVCLLTVSVMLRLLKSGRRLRIKLPISVKKVYAFFTVFSMIDSGARGSWAQPVQILGMKGLVTSPSGALPVKGNFKEGFGVLEYFISTHATRKGLSDTALRTANAGYLTRRLVDVSQDVIVTEEDCGDTTGMIVTRAEAEKAGEDFFKKIAGRFLAADLKDEKGKVIAKAGDLLSEEVIKEAKEKKVSEVNIRTILSCH